MGLVCWGASQSRQVSQVLRLAPGRVFQRKGLERSR
jgi:hypothetical protein